MHESPKPEGSAPSIRGAMIASCGQSIATGSMSSRFRVIVDGEMGIVKPVDRLAADPDAPSHVFVLQVQHLHHVADLAECLDPVERIAVLLGELGQGLELDE